MIRLAICDDHEMVREALSMVLESFEDISVVGATDGVVELEEIVRSVEPDVVLIDVRLGSESGLDAARRIRSADVQTKVVMLTSFAGDQVLVEASDAGAVGFLLKSGRPHEIVEAIRAVAEGANLIDGNEVEAARHRMRQMQPDE